MKKIISLSAFVMAGFTLKAQYKNDDIAFRTVYPSDLCDQLQRNKSYLLLDVRSPGEFADTSSNALYNLGHLKNAKNINVRELGSRLTEIADYKDKPVFVYCSHSQRSRRASKMLADSGFTNVINVNGGITAIRQVQNDKCLNELLQTNAKYSVISPAEFCTRLAAKNNSFILDVRSDSAYRHISTDAGVNWVGNYKNTVNIPLADLEKRINEVPKNKPILITDVFGSEAANAAAMLVNAGYQDVSVLQEGIRRTFLTDSRVQACRETDFISPVQYAVLSATDFGRMIVTKPKTRLLDIRSDDEYDNKSKDAYKNIGRLMNAIHIPADELAANLNDPALVKTDPIILYSFTGDKKVFEAADLLSKQGFTNLYVLGGGLFDVRWSAANTMGLGYLKRYVVNVPEENL